MSSDAAAQGRRHTRRDRLNAALGHPERGLAVVHVAGTNGKGSVVAMLAAILRAAGFRVGRFTSPDLQGPHERFELDGHALSPASYAALVASVAPAVAAVEADGLGPLPVFDRWTAMAWKLFADANVDIAIVEAGVGGTTDATNVVPKPLATVITAIGHDHLAQLGPTLIDVAEHKAGILRAGVPALTAARGEALDVIATAAGRLGTPLRAVAPLAGTAVPGGWQIEAGFLALPGRFQLENAALAIATIESLRAAGWNIRPQAVAAGLAKVSWPGRCEAIADPQGGTWLLDGAHNADALAALIASWDVPDVVVAGFRADKDAPAMVQLLADAVPRLVFVPIDPTRPGGEAPPEGSCWPPTDLAARVGDRARSAPDMATGLAMARALAPAGRRVVTGSLYLVAAARAALVGIPLSEVA